MTASHKMLRRAMLQATAVGPTAAMPVGMPQAQAAGSEAFPPHPSWCFAFVNHVTTNPFFVPTQYGIADACSLLGCEHQWTGSANSDVLEILNAAIAAKTAAIAVPIIDPKAFNAPVARDVGCGTDGHCPARIPKHT
jgi:simple sugar transport system substrate-binding protein